MSKKRLSIAAAAPPDVDDVLTLQRHDATTPQSGNVVTPQRQSTRKGASHSSFYASPRVLKALREIALARDCKVNDLILEGLRPILARDGRDLDDLNREG